MILAVIIVIVLVLVGGLGWFPGLSTGINEQQSKVYWASTSPLALKEWKITSVPTEAVFVVQNMTSKTIKLTEITVDGTDIIVEPDVSIRGGETVTITGTTGIASTSDYVFDVIITYDSGSITGLKFVGEKPIAGKIGSSGGSSPSCSCSSWNNSSCGTGSCSSNQMLQTRTCTLGCDSTEQCLDDSCEVWELNYCINEASWHDRTCIYGCLPTSELVDACDDSLILNCCNAWCVSQGAISGRCRVGNICRCRF